MANPTSDQAEISTESYNFLQQHVYRSSGIVVDDNKQYLLEARLLPIVQKENLKTINDLCALIRQTQGGRISQEVVEALTTNETSFFRDLTPFQALRQTLLPPLIEERQKSRRLTFWSAASSSGQEAYSLAMMLTDMGLADWNIDILGTDFNEKMVKRARAGSYVQIEVNRGLPAAHLIKYFNREGIDWRIKEEIRKMVRFETFNLLQPMRAMGPFDFVLCRNILIYFDVPTKKRILREIQGTLHRGGYLVLGMAETTLNLTDALERRSVDGAVFYRNS
jgi:chemotaxis protein methyltransferase CheR